MSTWLPYAVVLFVGLIALAAVMACALGAAYDRAAEDLDGLTPGELLAQREHEKSQLIVNAMTRDREAAFAAHAGSPFGEVPRVPKEGA